MAESQTIIRVELFEDRAAVTRRIHLPQAPGRHVVELTGLSPLVRQAGIA